MLLDTLLATTLACLFTGVGGFLIFLKKDPKRFHINMMLNTAAGVMLAASIFSLLSPAFEIVRLENKFLSDFIFMLAIAFGVFIIWFLNIIIPHEHVKLEQKGCLSIKKASLFVIAISIHKLPEGIAMGIAYAAKNFINPDSLIVGIALQNIPEGLAIALALYSAGIKKIKVALIATLIGFVQPLGAIGGIFMMNLSSSLLPFGMALAGSMMIFVIINEILPEIYKDDKDNETSISFFLGFLLMSYISVALA